MTRTLAAIASLLLIAGASSGPAQAVDWSGSGGNNNWSTPGNWVGGVAPPNNPLAILTFGAAGTTFTPFADTAWTLNQLDITGATPYQLTGGALIYIGSSLTISGAAHAIGNDINFLSPLTLTTASDLTYSGSMSGPSLVKAGAGRLVLTSATALTAFGGGIAINGGTLQLGNGVTGPPALPPNVVDNATLEFAGSALGPVAVPSGLTGTGNVVVSSGRVDAFGTALTHAGSTTITGTGFLIGRVTNNGALVIGAGARFDAVDTTVGSLAGAGALNVLGAGMTVGGDGTTTTFSGTIGGGGSFTKAGPGRLILTNTNPLAAFGAAPFTISGGVLQIGDGTTGPIFLPPNVVDNATLEFAGSGAVSVGMPSGLTGTGNVVVSGGRVDAFSTPLTHAGSTTITGTGFMTGRITNNGALLIGASARFDAVDTTVGSLAGAGTLNVLGAGMTVGGDNSNTTFSGTLGGGGTFAKTGSGVLTFSGTSIGSPAVVKAGTLILAGSMPGVTVNFGATIGGTGNVGSLVINDGAILQVGIEGTTPGTQYDSLNVGAAVTVTEATLSLTGGYVPSVGDVFMIVNNSGGLVTGRFAGLPEGGTLVFNGATLRISYVGGTGNDITLTTISTTARVWVGIGTNDNWSTNPNWTGGAAPASAPTTFVVFPAASARFSPVVDAPWTINRLDFTGVNAYSISGQAITFAGTTPRLNGSGAVHALANPLTLSAPLTVSNATALTLSGAIGGAASLTKGGVGVLTLSGAGSYAGATTVSAGTLLVNGTLAGPVTVGTGGTLGGSGAIAGAVTVAAGGTFAPGSSPGIISTGDLTLDGAMLVDIQGTTPGTQYDNANVTGTVTIGGTLTLAGAYVPVAGDTFTIVTNDGADAIAGTFSGLPEGATVPFNGGALQISYAGGTGNDVVLTAVTLATTTWNGAGADPNWSTGANWVGGVAPSNGSSTFVTFGPASARFGTVVDTIRNFNRMDISGGSAYTFIGQPITFTGVAPQLNIAGAVHSISNDLAIIASGPLSLTNSVDIQLSGSLSGGSLIKAGAGRLILSKSAPIPGGGITINGGTLQLGNGVTGPTIVPPNVVDNATLELAGSGAVSVGMGSGLTGTGNLVVSSGRADAFGPALTHAGSTTITGTGFMTGRIINNGALVIGAGARMDAIDTTVGSLAGAGALNVVGTSMTVGGDGTTTTFSGTIGGGGSFTKAGPGRLILTNTNPLAAFGAAPFTISGGVLQIGDGTTGPTFLPPNVVDNATLEFAGSGAISVGVPSGLTGTGNVVVSGGRVDAFGTALTHAGSTTIAGTGFMTGRITNNGALLIGATGRLDAVDTTVGSLAGAGVLNVVGANMTVGGDGTTTTFSGTIGGGGTFVMAGPGRLILTNTNPTAAFGSAPFMVNGGVLQVGNGITGPMFLPANVVDNATIDFVGSALTVAVPSGLTGTGNVVVSSGRVDVFSTPLAHAGSTTVTGTSLLTGRVTNNGALIIDLGARMDASDTTVGSLTGAGELNVFGATMTVGGDGTSTTFSGTIGGGGTFVKTGAGTLVLSGASTHAGFKTINGGTLLLTGSIAGVVEVNAGGTFGGTGVVNGSVTVNAGGTLAPGLSPGVINTGDINIAGALAVEIQGTALGTQYDNTNVTGTVTITGGTLALSGAYVPLVGDVFTIVTNDAADAITGTFAGLPEGTILTFNGSTLRISYIGGTGNDITLTAVSATALVWNGAGANDNWSTGANWVVGFAPTSGATTFLTFPAASARFGPVVDSAFTLNRMDITGASAYAMTGLGVTFAGATPQLNTSGAAHSIANPLTLSTALAVSNASTLTLSGAVGGAFTLTKSGAGTLLVNGTVAGPVTVAGGTLGGVGTIGGQVTVQAGATLSPGVSPGIINTGNLNLAGAALIEITGTTPGTQYDVINVTGTVTIAGGTLALAGAYVPVVGDVFTIVTNDGADAVTGTFTGQVEGSTLAFNGATLRISYIGGTGNDITLTAISTTTVVWNGAGVNDNMSTGPDWVGGVAPTSGPTTFVTFPAASARFAPVVDAPFTLNRIDITSASAYAISGQAITFAGAAPQLNTSGAVHAIANPLTLSAALAVSNASTLALSGAVGGAFTVTKTGAGTLLVNGTVAGPVTVAGGTLGGTGAIAGPVTVQAGATLSPGLSPGIINVGSLNLAGVALIEIDGATLGTQYDNVNVTGTVTLAGATLTLSGAYVPVPGNTFTIISNDGADPVVGTFAGLPQGTTVVFNGVNLRISYVGGTGNDVVLVAAPAGVAGGPIPTLSQWALILLALLMAGAGARALRIRRPPPTVREA